MCLKDELRNLITFKVILLSILSFNFPSFGQVKTFEDKDLKNLQYLLKTDPQQYVETFQKTEKRLLESGQKDRLVDLYLFRVSHLTETANFDSALVYLYKARILYSNTKERQLIPVHLSFASLFHSKGNIDSLKYYQELVEQVINEKSAHYGHFLLNQALISGQNSDYKQAIELVFEAIKLFESNQDFNKLAVAYNNLAFSYEHLGDLDTHIQYLQKALVLNKKLGNTYRLIMNYNNLGSSHRQKDLLVEAIAYYDSAFVQLEKLYNPLQMAQNILNRANIYKRKGDVEVAEPLYLQALSICEANNIPYGEMLGKINLGDLYRQKRQYEKSGEVLASALDLSFRLKAKREEALIYEKQAWLARDLADFRVAYNLLDKYHVLNDSLVNESVRKEANALREKYELGKKENEILSLSKEKLFQQLIIAGMAVGLLIAIILLQWWRNKHKLLSKENQKQELKRKHLRETLINKDKELTAQAAQLIQMQQLLETAKSNITNILSDNTIEVNKIKKVKAVLSNNAVLSIKKDFDLRITESNKDFFDILLKFYPDLKPAELKLCAYLRLNLTTKEIAEISNKSTRTIENIRLSIRKKMSLEGSDSLVSHLIALEVKGEIDLA